MAKGKAAANAARRREAEARQAQLDSQHDLSDAREEIVSLKRRLAEQDVFTGEIVRLRKQVEDNTSDQLEALQERHYELLRRFAVARKYVERVEKIHNKAGFAAVVALGGGRGSLADMIAIINDGQRAVMITNDYVDGLPGHVIEAIERKRGGVGAKQNIKTRQRTLTQLLQVETLSEVERNTFVTLLGDERWSFSGFPRNPLQDAK